MTFRKPVRPQFGYQFVFVIVGLWLVCSNESVLPLRAAGEKAAPAVAADQLVVHEWGTFTSLVDELGKPLTGINVDDEPLPPFVHNLNSYVLGPQHAVSKAYPMKGAPPAHPYVTLRLETPVMYFYPPRSQPTPFSLDVDVQFRGGWLTQFYPQATADAPGLNEKEFKFGPINRDTVGSLSWKHLTIGGKGELPHTDEPVWLTPRNVPSANVGMPDGETERYLFYRGVGNIDAPLSASTDLQKRTIALQSRCADVLKQSEQLSIPALWLASIRADGAAAFRTLAAVTLTSDEQKQLASVPVDFKSTDFSVENLDRLEREMHAALVAQGLFDEEATVMLQTWQKSYFKSAGLRLFYVVPRQWTDHYLPLTLSKPAEVTRVMVARTELIGDAQRQLLEKLSAAKIGDANWLENIPVSYNRNRFMQGHSDFGDLGVKIPPEYQTYLDLGRFRNALLIYQQAHHPSPALAKFIEEYDLSPFQVPAQAGK